MLIRSKFRKASSDLDLDAALPGAAEAVEIELRRDVVHLSGREAFIGRAKERRMTRAAKRSQIAHGRLGPYRVESERR